MDSAKDRKDSIFLEFQQVGNSVKVTAIDPVSLIEVTIIAPVSSTQTEMSRIAVQKLKRRIAEEDAANKPTTDKSSSDTPGSGRGILV
ncbi:MAG: serine hydroxymethyltransferase [Pseudomonadota bacterium]